MDADMNMIAAYRFLDPQKFSDFVNQPENKKYMNANGTISTVHVEDLVESFRASLPKEELDNDRLGILQTLHDRR